MWARLVRPQALSPSKLSLAPLVFFCVRQVWFERRCGMSFAEEEKLLKHKAKCKVDLVAGLLAGFDAAAVMAAGGEGRGGLRGGSRNDAVGRGGVGAAAAAQLYRQHPAWEPGGASAGVDVKGASNSFEPSSHRRVPVLGDPNSRFAPGARRRRNEDAKVSMRVGCLWACDEVPAWSV